jgi:hypothetical protein
LALTEGGVVRPMPEGVYRMALGRRIGPVGRSQSVTYPALRAQAENNFPD